MESILSKVHVKLANLAATYADARYKNVMLSVISDFQHAIQSCFLSFFCQATLAQNQYRDANVHTLITQHPLNEIV
jgi:hypothetical protein